MIGDTPEHRSRSQIVRLWRDDSACSDQAVFVRAVNRNAVCSRR